MFGDLFGFMDMAGNYESRKVDNFETENLVVDTCRVTDGDKDYETAVASPNYNNGDWVIVEAYDTKEEAQLGHDKWVEKMINNPPANLIDCANSKIGQMYKDFGGDVEFGLTIDEEKSNE